MGSPPYAVQASYNYCHIVIEGRVLPSFRPGFSLSWILYQLAILSLVILSYLHLARLGHFKTMNTRLYMTTVLLTALLAAMQLVLAAPFDNKATWSAAVGPSRQDIDAGWSTELVEEMRKDGIEEACATPSFASMFWMIFCNGYPRLTFGLMAVIITQLEQHLVLRRNDIGVRAKLLFVLVMFGFRYLFFNPMGRLLKQCPTV